MGQIKNTPFSLGSIVPKIIDCYSGNQNDARNQKIHSEVMDNFFEVKLSFLTGVRAGSQTSTSLCSIVEGEGVKILKILST